MFAAPTLGQGWQGCDRVRPRASLKRVLQVQATARAQEMGETSAGDPDKIDTWALGVGAGSAAASSAGVAVATALGLIASAPRREGPLAVLSPRHGDRLLILDGASGVTVGVTDVASGRRRSIQASTQLVQRHPHAW